MQYQQPSLKFKLSYLVRCYITDKRKGLGTISNSSLNLRLLLQPKTNQNSMYNVTSKQTYSERFANRVEVYNKRTFQGRSQDFSRGGGGDHTVSNIIVMAFSPRNIVGCFLKKSLTKGGSRAPQDPLTTPLRLRGIAESNNNNNNNNTTTTKTTLCI